MSILGIYEEMDRISAQMVEAARANNWDRLVALEQDVSSLRHRLDACNRSVQLSEEERSRKVALIHHILDNDAEVRRHTEPWMEGVRQFLGNGTRGRNLRRAYGAGTPQ